MHSHSFDLSSSSHKELGTHVDSRDGHKSRGIVVALVEQFCKGGGDLSLASQRAVPPHQKMKIFENFYRKQILTK
jgi:hypothetical protein